MATTPTTSIGSSYQRLGGSTTVIKQGAAGPALSAATQERLRLAEQRKLEEERAAAEARRQANLFKTNLPQWAAEQKSAEVNRMGGASAYNKYMNEMGGDPNKPYIPSQFRK